MQNPNGGGTNLDGQQDGDQGQEQGPLAPLVTRMGLALRFPDGEIEKEFKREHGQTYLHLDAGWAVLSTSLVILLLPRLFERAQPYEICLGVSCIPTAISPLYFYRCREEFWLRNRGKLLGAVRFYKSVLAIYLSHYYVDHSAVKDWPHLFRYLLLNGRIAVLLHLSVGMRLLFSEFLLLQTTVLALLVPLAPRICMVETPLHLGPIPLHDLFVHIARFLSRATALLSIMPYGYKGFPDRACVEVLVFLQILIGLVLPAMLVYSHERRWRSEFAVRRGVQVLNPAIRGGVEYPLATFIAITVGACFLWQILETVGLMLVTRPQ